MSAEFVACMEDVLDLYAEPYDPKRPVVCFDETSKQLVAEKRAPIPARAGRQERFDYEYQRNGTRNLFMTCEPLAGWRHVAVTERRTMEDFAHQMRWLSDAAYPEAEKVRVVLDNLNTHRPASLYEAFEPKEARRVIQRLEFHYTPKHGSWLNMAEIEFSVFSNQCLNRRVEDEVSLKREIAALETERNQAGATIEWRFTTTDARHKLRRIYPSVLDDPVLVMPVNEGDHPVLDGRCRSGYRPASCFTEAETNGKKDTADIGGRRWDERAVSAQVAVWTEAEQELVD